MDYPYGINQIKRARRFDARGSAQKYGDEAIFDLRKTVKE
jgi:hypothetical protein